jgi:hypothetical protein
MGKEDIKYFLHTDLELSGESQRANLKEAKAWTKNR